MRDNFHPGTFAAGVVFTLLGIALVLEAAGAWSLKLHDLAIIGPIGLIVIGGAVLVASIWHGNPKESNGAHRV
jgi:hypothetical protein